MYATLNDKNSLDVMVIDEDDCYTCANMNRCPLMASIQKELVIMRFSDISIKACGMYEEIEEEL